MSDNEITNERTTMTITDTPLVVEPEAPAWFDLDHFVKSRDRARAREMVEALEHVRQSFEQLRAEAMDHALKMHLAIEQVRAADEFNLSRAGLSNEADMFIDELTGYGNLNSTLMSMSDGFDIEGLIQMHRHRAEMEAQLGERIVTGSDT